MCSAMFLSGVSFLSSSLLLILYWCIAEEKVSVLVDRCSGIFFLQTQYFPCHFLALKHLHARFLGHRKSLASSHSSLWFCATVIDSTSSPQHQETELHTLYQSLLHVSTWMYMYMPLGCSCFLLTLYDSNNLIYYSLSFHYELSIMVTTHCSTTTTCYIFVTEQCLLVVPLVVALTWLFPAVNYGHG